MNKLDGLKCYYIYLNLKYNRFLSTKSTQMEQINTFVFFDSETTGLPSQEHNKTRIIELCLAAVQREHINLGVFPRILPKISLCFNPKKYIHPEATNLSGITNDLVDNQPEFSCATAGLLQDFLKIQRKPICFVAHNGNRFDYPILRAELYNAGSELPHDILCVDSLVAFKQLHNEDVAPQMKLNQSVKDIPFELQDGYDELLLKVVTDLENSTNDMPMKSNMQKPLTVAEIQRRNETTPQKPIISCNPRYNKSSMRKQLSFEHPLSFKLGDLYQLFTQKTPIDAHQAECDVVMLIECVATMGQRFTNWANLNAIKFCDIPIMRPGKSIGT